MFTVKKFPAFFSLALTVLTLLTAAPAADAAKPKPLSISEQGIFSAGGVTITSPGTFNPADQWEATGAGQTLHADHCNVLYQIPKRASGLPMVFLHGYGQSRMGWMTTPDGREGWSTMFLKMGHSVWLLDEPRRGEAGTTSVSGAISTKTLDQRWYTQFRLGRWENGRSVLNAGSAFPPDARSLDQFFRQMTPDTGMRSDMGADFDTDMVAAALAEAIEEVYARTGQKVILVTHSQGGYPGWRSVGLTDKIAAIIAIEPGNAPAPDSRDYAAILEQRIPVAIYFGDYIDNGDQDLQATAMWRQKRDTCYAFTQAYNLAGASGTVIDLPREGITGNSHFLFQELNNRLIAGHVQKWIKANVRG